MNLTNEYIIKELERELRMRLRVYPGQIAQGKLSKNLANKRYMAMNSLKELIQAFEESGVTVDHMIQLLKNVEKRAQAKQGKLQF